MSLSSSEDPELNFLEKKITSSKKIIPANARTNLRYLNENILHTLAIQSRWKIGIVSSFFDGKNYSTDFKNDTQNVAVEVLFEDATLHLYNNKLLLRNLDEIKLRYSNLYTSYIYNIPLC